ncbi:MAG: M67 family metallopeptidase [Cenarchaeum sp. SB0665_bin_23]|nr:M67 family metallopeptidase [Cenarchaeum sp. SB0665_bin_23]MYB46297.1 M67 family metallopeptidase [Cenarchaeum sp. SB0662_bin_33]MYG33799.1 M67 family metallopeptidase [Cenarchaeum sp. SB0677_bin_16]
MRDRNIQPIKIIIDGRLLASMARHSVQCAPNEACGIIYGNIRDDAYIVEDVKFVENASSSPIQFTMSNADTIRAYDSNSDVVGIYHSHPTSAAIPSGMDREYMLINPVAWVIYSGADQKFRAWHMTDDIHELLIKTENSG